MGASPRAYCLEIPVVVQFEFSETSTEIQPGSGKKLEDHGHMVALRFMHYNYCRVHKTLRVTPAMEVDLTDHVWSSEELVGLAASVWSYAWNSRTHCNALNWFGLWPCPCVPDHQSR